MSISNYSLIANTISRYFIAVDDRDWRGVTELMTNPFHLDYSSFGGGDPADLAPQDILAGWQALLPGFDHTHHQIGNLVTDTEGELAAASCYGTATHLIGERVWTVVGRYDFTLTFGAGHWQLSGLRFRFKYQSGALDLPNDAQARVASG